MMLSMCYRMMLIIVPNPILILKNVAIVISIILIHLKRIDVGTFGAINTWRKYSSTDL
jgi:1-aminocyclopropane-1-carboxylate deaminase/D-cysteine desulfhydrase-like pyridoxal-dependent ACC family enzyme